MTARLAAVVLAAGLAACSGGGDEGRGEIGFVEGFLGGVAADEPRAALIGRDILSAGGTATDAAVGVYFAMAVTLPSSASLGGGGACLVHDAESGTTEALEFFARLPETRSPGTGGGSSSRPAAVPGNPRGFFALHSKYGRLRWSQLVAPSENLARFGVQVSRALARDLDPLRDALLAEAETRQVFLAESGDLLVKEGDFFRQLDLAVLLGRIRTQGPGILYTGATANAFVDAVSRAGGGLSVDDVRSFAPAWRQTVRVPLGNQVAHFTPPPADGGVVAAQILAMLNEDDRLADAPAVERNHLLVEVARRAFADRERWLNGVVVDEPNDLVAEARLESLLATYDPDRHGPPDVTGLVVKERPENPAAATFVTVDREGSAVACAVTLNSLFGTGRIAPGTGVLLAAAPGPGGRGASALGPMLVVNENVNEFFFAGVAAGGVAAPTSLASVAARALLLDQPLADAVAAKRVHHGGAPDLVFHEDGFSAPVLQNLLWRRHRVAATPALGRVNAIACKRGIPPHPETCEAQADPRGFGLAVSAD